MKVTMNETKNIALIAHDNKKDELLQWVRENKEKLVKHNLFGTGTTAKILTEKTGLNVKGFKSGPLGGDQQIGAKIVEGNIDVMIFFWDPLTAHSHDTDVKALLRIAVLYNIPTAMNSSTADFMLHSLIIETRYEREVLDYVY